MNNLPIEIKENDENKENEGMRKMNFRVLLKHEFLNL